MSSNKKVINSKLLKTNNNINDFIVIDDVLPTEVQVRIENTILSPTNTLSYTLLTDAVYSGANYVNNVKKYHSDMESSGWLENSAAAPQFVHGIFNRTLKEVINSFNPSVQQDNAPKNLILSPLLENIMPLLTALPHVVIGLGRVKINLVPRVTTTALYSAPHIDNNVEDMPSNAMIGVYYINDSDGDTYIFNQTYQDYIKPGIKPKLTLKAKVSPKRGRLVVFNARYVHAAGLPKKNDFRAVVNINYIGGERKIM